MTETIATIVSSPRKLCFTVLSGKLTLGPLGSVPKQQLHVIMSEGLDNPTLPFSLTMLRGPALPWGALCPNSSGEEHGSHNNSALQSRSSLQNGRCFDVVPGPD